MGKKTYKNITVKPIAGSLGAEILDVDLKKLNDLNLSEGIVLFLLLILVLLLGFYPNLILNTIHASVEGLIRNYEQAIIFNLNTIK